MASKSNITILSNPTTLLEVITYPKKTSEVVAIGDPMQDDGSAACEVVESADNTTFLGISMEASRAADVKPISIMIKGVIQAQVAAASSNAATFGAAFSWTSGANGTDWTFSSNTVDGIIWALEPIAKGSSGKFMVDVLALESGIIEEVNDTSTSTSTTSTSTSTTSTSTTSTSSSTTSTSTTTTG